jgi:hypothetical protein
MSLFVLKGSVSFLLVVEFRKYRGFLGFRFRRGCFRVWG